MFTFKKLAVGFATFACTITMAVVGLMLFVPQTAEAGKPDTFNCCTCDNQCQTVIDRFAARAYCYDRWNPDGTAIGGTCWDKNQRQICTTCQ